MSAVESKPVRVNIPQALVNRTGNQRWVRVHGDTVREVIDALDDEYPGLKFNVCFETGELRQFVNIFVQGDDVRGLQGLDTPVPPGATLYIIHSIAGG
jgi:molybdopterin synthase sulfur carrier subunit